MKILYDYQIFNIQRFGGISRYFIELMKSLNQSGCAEFLLPLVACQNGYVHASEFIQCFDTTKLGFVNSSKIHKASVRLNRWYTQFYSMKREFDVYHPTYYDPYLLDSLGNKPIVVTVYDMIHEIFRDQYRNSNVMAQKQHLVSKASKIIAISESTKRDLITILGVDKQKIEVIYLASSFGNTSVYQVPDVKVPDSYILFVGDRWHYKNFEFFIRSMPQPLRDDSHLHIVCAGSIPFSEKELALISSLGIADRVLHYPVVSDGVLIHLYKNARAFVFPSRYEGFGIPILEAFSCECPVIASNSSSLPEVGGDACLYIDPRDSISLVKTVRKVIYNEDVRLCLVAKGKEQLRKFSWAETTRQTVAVYSNLCS